MSPPMRRLVGAAIGAAAAAFVEVAGRFLESERLPADDHRPWPAPDAPWAMAQTWAHVLFAHWPVPPSAIRPLAPPGLDVDTFDGSAWAGVTAFVVRGARLRGLPAVPGFSDFAEVNVRTYVSADDKPGVLFLSLDAASAAAVMGASTWYALPYFLAGASLTLGPSGVRFSSERAHPGAPTAAFAATYRPRGAAAPARRGSLAWWLTERYCAYTGDGTSLTRIEIHHPPWPLAEADVEVTRNTIARAAGIDVDGAPPVAHYSEGVDALVWSPARLARGHRRLRRGRARSR